MHVGTAVIREHRWRKTHVPYHLPLQFRCTIAGQIVIQAIRDVLDDRTARTRTLWNIAFSSAPLHSDAMIDTRTIGRHRDELETARAVFGSAMCYQALAHNSFAPAPSSLHTQRYYWFFRNGYCSQRYRDTNTTTQARTLKDADTKASFRAIVLFFVCVCVFGWRVSSARICAHQIANGFLLLIHLLGSDIFMAASCNPLTELSTRFSNIHTSMRNLLRLNVHALLMPRALQ